MIKIFILVPSIIAIYSQDLNLESQGSTCVNLPFKSDGFLLVLNWPIAFCAKNQYECVLETPVHKWLIHGLWPQFNITKQGLVQEINESPFPQYCCHQQDQLVPETLEANGITGKMLKYWYSLQKPNRGKNILTQSFQFWQHEWSKHGTCAVKKDGKNPITQEEYFLTTLKLVDQFQIDRLLKRAKIYPSNKRLYTRRNIHKALSSLIDLGAIRLNCDRLPHSDGNVGVLNEIQICLDLYLQPVNCGYLIDSGFSRKSIEINSGDVDDHECGEKIFYMST